MNPNHRSSGTHGCCACGAYGPDGHKVDCPRPFFGGTDREMNKWATDFIRKQNARHDRELRERELRERGRRALRYC